VERAPSPDGYAPVEAGGDRGGPGRGLLAEEVDVKKLVILAVAAAAGFMVWKKMQDDQAEQDLWTEATNEYADLR
jgi:hypothetical protein